MGITTKELAQLCGVSRTTVHRALHDLGRVSEETRERILETARKYDYRPDMLARGLVKGKSFSIGVVVMDVDNRYFSQMLNNVVREVKKRSYSVNIALHEKDQGKEEEQLRRLSDYHVDGIILSSTNKGEDYKKFLESFGTPVVTIDNKIAEGIPFVGIRNRQAAGEAARLIVQKGYEKVVFVCPPLEDKAKENVYVHEERERGFREAMEGCPEVEAAVIGRWDYLELSYRELVNTERKTAFFCTGDMMALDLKKFLQERGKEVVRDYGLMGFDHIDFLKYISPRLSTIDNSVETVAKEAVELLFDLIGGEETETERILGYRTVEGETLRDFRGEGKNR